MRSGPQPTLNQVASIEAIYQSSHSSLCFCKETLTCKISLRFLQVYLHALGVLHGGDVDEFEMLLTAELSSHVSELLCYPDETQVQVELRRECHYPVPEYTH